MSVGLPSLELLLATVRWERDLQLQHFDGLDTKAGLVLGFSGLLTALSANVPGPFRLLGLIATVTAGGLALAAFWPRRLPALELANLRSYLTAEEQFAKLTLHDTLIAMDHEGATVLKSKAGRLKSALGALAAAIVFLAVGIAYDGLNGASNDAAGAPEAAVPAASSPPAGP